MAKVKIRKIRWYHVWWCKHFGHKYWISFDIRGCNRCLMWEENPEYYKDKDGPKD